MPISRNEQIREVPSRRIRIECQRLWVEGRTEQHSVGVWTRASRDGSVRRGYHWACSVFVQAVEDLFKISTSCIC